MLQPLYLIPQASHVALLRVLQVQVDASDAEIKKAYRKLSLQVLGHCHCSDHAGCRVAWRGADMQRCRLAGSRSAAWPFRKRRRAAGCAAATPAFDACPLSFALPSALQYHPDKNPDPKAHQYFATYIAKASRGSAGWGCRWLALCGQLGLLLLVLLCSLLRMSSKAALIMSRWRSGSKLTAAILGLVQAYKALTDEVSKENYKKYGHPDGPQAMSGAQSGVTGAPKAAWLELLFADSGQTWQRLTWAGCRQPAHLVWP